jgi:hypothetical protein
MSSISISTHDASITPWTHHIEINDLLDEEMIENNRTVAFVQRTAQDIYSRLLTGVFSSDLLCNSLNNDHDEYDAMLDGIMDDMFSIGSSNISNGRYGLVAAQLSNAINQLTDWAEINHVYLG